MSRISLKALNEGCLALKIDHARADVQSSPRAATGGLLDSKFPVKPVADSADQKQAQTLPTDRSGSAQALAISARRLDGVKSATRVGNADHTCTKGQFDLAILRAFHCIADQIAHRDANHGLGSGNKGRFHIADTQPRRLIT